MPPFIHEERCTHCGLCAAICPMQLFKHEKKMVPIVAYPKECWHCNACVLDCPENAVELRIPLNYSLLHVDVTTLHS